MEIHCRHLPGTRFNEWEDVRLGVQRGAEVEEDVSADVDRVTFTLPIQVRRAADGQPDFRGPHAQGRPGERFVYLCWGVREDGRWEGFRRAKVRLDGLDWGSVHAAATTGTPIQIALDMTDAKGGPLCGSVRPWG